MGPPFSGALLLPRRLALDLAGRDPLPPGFGDYFGRGEWPDGWRGLTDALPAAAESRSAVCAGGRRCGRCRRCARCRRRSAGESIGELGAAIEDTLQGAAALEPVDAAVDGVRTIFAFRVLRSGTALDLEAARQVWRWLREDLGERLPASASQGERRLAAQVCHVGQPVRIGAAAALRLCIGARSVSQVAFDPALGSSLDQRLARQIGRARIVLDKAALIARHLDRLSAALPGSSRYSSPGLRPSLRPDVVEARGTSALDAAAAPHRSSRSSFLG